MKPRNHFICKFNGCAVCALFLVIIIEVLPIVKQKNADFKIVSLGRVSATRLFPEISVTVLIITV